MLRKWFGLLIFLLIPSLWATGIVLDLNDVSLKDALSQLAKQTGKEIIADDSLQVKITASVRCSSLEEALKALSILYPRMRWATLSFPAKEKISNEDLILTAKALQSVKLSKLILKGQDGDVLFSKAERASFTDKDFKTVYVVWAETPSPQALLSTQRIKLSPQDYLNLNWMMLNAFLSMSPEERKQVLLSSFNMMLQDPTLLQRIMQESFATMMTFTPEEMGKLIGASFQAMQSIPPEFWQQMMQMSAQLMQQLGPQLQQMSPQLPQMTPPNGGGTQ